MTHSLIELRIGGVAIDIPRSVGYFGGVTAAVSAGLIEPPLGLFIAAVPLIKALTHRRAPTAVRLIGEILEGGAKPIGGEPDAVVKLVDEELSDEIAVALAEMVDRGHGLQRGGLGRSAHAGSRDANQT